MVDVLIECESVFREAGDLAKDIRRQVKVFKKGNTGIEGLDMVTEADYQVQEYVLSRLADTGLSDCEMIAEEDTESVKKFKGVNGLVLTIDPIDGTKIYAGEGSYYSVIICLHDKDSYLYSHAYYPEFKWAKRVTRDGAVDFGQAPKVELKEGLEGKKIIAYGYREPEKVAPELYEKLTALGYEFMNICDITKKDDAWPCSLLYLGQVAGCYNDNPGAYDGLCALHYGKAMGFDSFSNINLVNGPVSTPKGPRYPGFYAVWQ